MIIAVLGGPGDVFVLFVSLVYEYNFVASLPASVIIHLNSWSDRWENTLSVWFNYVF